jgi:hypothetical protein
MKKFLCCTATFIASLTASTANSLAITPHEDDYGFAIEHRLNAWR